MTVIIFSPKATHSGPYVSSQPKARADTEAEAETPAVEPADEVVEPVVENINDNAESGDLPILPRLSMKALMKITGGTRFPNSNGGLLADYSTRWQCFNGS